MSPDDINSFFSELQAATGTRLKKDEEGPWRHWAGEVEYQSALDTLRHLEQAEGQRGFTQYKGPTLSRLRHTEKWLSTRGESEDYTPSNVKHPRCDRCGTTGTVYVVIAGNSAAHSKVRRRGDTSPADYFRVEKVNCGCPAGDALSEFFKLGKEARRTIKDFCSYKCRGEATQVIRDAKGVTLKGSFIKGDITSGRAKATARVNKPTHDNRQRDAIDVAKEWE